MFIGHFDNVDPRDEMQRHEQRARMIVWSGIIISLTIFWTVVIIAIAASF